MEYYIKVLVLAVIQGAAELLPVSSSAHVILAEKLMRLDPSKPEQTFLLIMLHTGTMFAVLFYFWPRWQPLLWHSPAAGATPGGSRNRFLWLTVLATAISVGLYGIVWVVEKGTHSEVEELFKRLDLIGVALACAGVLILISGFLEGRVRPGELTTRTAILIGAIQAVCLPFRGFSRSGATISTGLLCGLPRALAEDFSFALAILITPPAILKMVLRLLKTRDAWTWNELLDNLLPGLVGMVFSFAAGYVALHLLSAALENGRWKYFGFYCLAAAGVLFAFAACGL